MKCLHRVVALLLAILLASASAPVSAAGEGKADAPLAEALEEWVRCLEQGNATSAANWAADAEAAKAQGQWWDQLRQGHKDHNYRAWLDRDPATGGPGVRHVGDATTFTVGGHSYGQLHVKWVKGKAGWRIGGVWACR